MYSEKLYKVQKVEGYMNYLKIYTYIRDNLFFIIKRGEGGGGLYRTFSPYDLLMSHITTQHSQVINLCFGH